MFKGVKMLKGKRIEICSKGNNTIIVFEHVIGKVSQGNISFLSGPLYL